MKKAKIMLMAIAIFGAVGDALAFKSTKLFNTSILICGTTFNSPITPICFQKAGFTTTNVGPIQAVVYGATTTSPFGTCKNTGVPVPYFCTFPVTTFIAVNPGE